MVARFPWDNQLKACCPFWRALLVVQEHDCTVLLSCHKALPNFKGRRNRLHFSIGECQSSRRAGGTGNITVAIFGKCTVVHRPTLEEALHTGGPERCPWFTTSFIQAIYSVHHVPDAASPVGPQLHSRSAPPTQVLPLRPWEVWSRWENFGLNSLQPSGKHCSGSLWLQPRE